MSAFIHRYKYRCFRWFPLTCAENPFFGGIPFVPRGVLMSSFAQVKAAQIEVLTWQAKSVFINSSAGSHDCAVSLSIDSEIRPCQLFNITNCKCVVSRCMCKRACLWCIYASNSLCVHSAWLGTVLELVRWTCTPPLHTCAHTHILYRHIVLPNSYPDTNLRTILPPYSKSTLEPETGFWSYKDEFKMLSNSKNILILNGYLVSQHVANTHKHTERMQSNSITDINIGVNEIHLTSTLNSLFISEVRECHHSEFARLCAYAWLCAGRCDVIILMVFYWDWSLNEDIKAVACFYMHGRVTCGGHGCFKSSLMYNGGTHKCTPGGNHRKWAKYAWVGLLHLCSGEKRQFIFFSHSKQL